MGVVRDFLKSRRENVKEKMINWLISCGVLHDVTQSAKFIDMFRVYDPKLTVPSCETFIEGLKKRLNNASDVFIMMCLFD